jgi:hypothetical protein
MVVISKIHTKKVQVLTPWGMEPAVNFMGQHFIPTQKFANLNDAIKACRRNLDAGVFSIVIKDKETQQVMVCSPLPAELATLSA